MLTAEVDRLTGRAEGGGSSFGKNVGGTRWVRSGGSGSLARQCDPKKTADCHRHLDGEDFDSKDCNPVRREQA
jgi:hypothetical protein